jgi:integrase
MTTEILPYKEPHALADLTGKLPALFLPDEKTAERFFGFFTANIRNPHTRRAYYKAACRFADWCEGRGLSAMAAVKPHHVAAYIEALQGGLSKPSVKQHLAALRMLFDWLVVGHTLEVNPAHAVRGPRYSQKKGKTPVLDREEARALIESIDTSTLTGLRDRALIATMIYTFARVSAVLQLNVRDGAAGSASTKRAARNRKRPATTSWKCTWTNTSRRRALRMTRTARCSAPRDAPPASRAGWCKRMLIKSSSAALAKPKSRPKSAIIACAPPASPIT